MIKVKAKLSLDNDKEGVLYLDVPKEKCTRENFLKYIKHCLLAQYGDDIKFDYKIVKDNDND